MSEWGVKQASMFVLVLGSWFRTLAPWIIIGGWWWCWRSGIIETRVFGGGNRNRVMDRMWIRKRLILRGGIARRGYQCKRTPESESNVSIVVPCTAQKSISRRSKHSVTVVVLRCEVFSLGRKKKQLKVDVAGLLKRHVFNHVYDLSSDQHLPKFLHYPKLN